MAIARAVQEAMASSSAIRKMFEEGLLLKKQYGQDNVFDFSLGNPDLEPPPSFGRVLARLSSEEAAEADGEESPRAAKGRHGYMPNAGFPEAREAMSKKASADHRCEVPPSHIVMSAGAAGGLNVVFKSIVNPGDEVIVPKPLFMEYRAYVSNHGGALIEVESMGGDFSLDTAAIEKALSSKTAAVLINSPHNPTGRVYPAEDIAALARVLRRHGGQTGRRPYLVSDEPYREIVYGGLSVPPVLCAYEESIAVSSFSKSLSLPGERIGYIAAGPHISNPDETLGALIYATRTLGFVNAPALMQRIAAEICMDRVPLEVYNRRRLAFKEVLDRAGISYIEPEGAFYLFAKAPPGRNNAKAEDSEGVGGDRGGNCDKAFAECLKKQRILAVPGSSFGAPGWIRFAFCTDETRIRASSDAFARAMREWNAAGAGGCA